MREVGDASLVVAFAGELDTNGLRQLALGLRERITGPSVVVVGSTSGSKGALVGAATRDLLARGVSAGDLLAAGSSALARRSRAMSTARPDVSRQVMCSGMRCMRAQRLIASGMSQLPEPMSRTRSGAPAVRPAASRAMKRRTMRMPPKRRLTISMKR